MADKADKMKARLPRGFGDRMADDIRAVDAMMGKIRDKFELYGFEPVEQPFIEYTDALGKFLPDLDRPNEGVFSFQDDDGQEARNGEAATGKRGEWLSLRYDLTAPLARFVAENFEQLPKPYRSYRSGWVFRNEKPGPGRFRQFMQFDADIVGTPGVAADAEMAMMMADTLEAVGIKRGDYVIRVNNRKVLDGVLEAIGLGGDENAGKRLTVLRAIDKLDKFGPEGVRELLGKGRLDESGDFTKGAGLDKEQIQKVLIFALLKGGNVTELEDVTNLPLRQAQEKGEVLRFTAVDGEEAGQFVESNKGVIDGLLVHFGSNATSRGGIEELDEIAKLVKAAGYERDRIRIDPSVVRGLEYYTGPVYEAELLFEVPNEKGEIVRFGSVAGGGRYDGLVSRFRGEPVPATGFSIGVSRLTTALKNLDMMNTTDVIAPVVVLVMDRDIDAMAKYQGFVSQLRNAKDKDGKPAGIRAEMYLGGSGMKAQMKYADRRGSPCVIIQGGDERENGEVQIKDLIEGARLSAEIEDNTAWREGRPAQVSVPESELVEAVQKILAAQKADRAKLK